MKLGDCRATLVTRPRGTLFRFALKLDYADFDMVLEIVRPGIVCQRVAIRDTPWAKGSTYGLQHLTQDGEVTLLTKDEVLCLEMLHALTA